ncbi:MAG: (d)CMP kinase [Balneolaceae bacterium]|nr:MAG: (d)CMP kinase [Balneolaceae bacterium]
MIIVIDGPAGSGKSSTAKEIANRLNIHFLDSGALYRALTYYWIVSGKPDIRSFIKLLPEVDISSEYRDKQFYVALNGEDITNTIRTQHVAENVSEIASKPQIRAYVNNYMRNLVLNDIYIADGRDLGTAVFPDADLKFFMTASIEERAKRRLKEMTLSDLSITLKDVEENIRQRDLKDQSRASDPLKKADDAIEIDTTGKTFDEQINQMITIIENQTKLN